MARKISKNPTTARRLEALSKISKAITSDLYIEDILKLIVSVTAEVMKSKICSLWLIDQKDNKIKLRATQTISKEYLKERSLGLGEGIVGNVVEKGRPAMIMDVLKEPKYKEKTLAKKEGLRSMLSIPMKVKNRVVGVINCYTSEPHKFTRVEINVLTTVANQAAIVIENARLLVESQVIKEELETRKVVERAKGILMKQEGLSEEEAFRRIQRFSMDTRRDMRQIAEAIILTSKMKRTKRKN